MDFWLECEDSKRVQKILRSLKRHKKTLERVKRMREIT